MEKFSVIDVYFRSFCENLTDETQSFCAEHRHLENGRMVRILNEVGSRVDQKAKTFHVAAGIQWIMLKRDQSKKIYEYCPSVEGLLPAWLESVEHLIRWLSVCYQVYEHPDRQSVSRFPIHLFYEEFPEIVDIEDYLYFHGFWATYESLGAYALDRKVAWERHVPTLLHQLGAMQQFIPYHQAINPNRFQEGGFEWKTGKQNHTYAKDIFDLEGVVQMPKCPALRLRKDLDGTASPSWEGITAQKPKVSYNGKIFRVKLYIKLTFV